MYLWISYHLLAIYHSPGIALLLCSFWGQSVLAGLIYWNQAPSCCPSWHVFPVWYLQLQTHICGLTGCLGASPSSFLATNITTRASWINGEKNPQQELVFSGPLPSSYQISLRYLHRLCLVPLYPGKNFLGAIIWLIFTRVLILEINYALHFDIRPLVLWSNFRSTFQGKIAHREGWSFHRKRTLAPE